MGTFDGIERAKSSPITKKAFEIIEHRGAKRMIEAIKNQLEKDGFLALREPATYDLLWKEYRKLKKLNN